MATNEKFRYANRIELPVAEGVKSGDPVQVGSLMGVAQTDRDAEGNASVWLEGAHYFELDDAVTAGQPVYIADGSLTLDSEGGEVFGHSIETTSAAGPVAVKIARV